LKRRNRPRKPRSFQAGDESAFLFEDAWEEQGGEGRKGALKPSDLLGLIAVRDEQGHHQIDDGCHKSAFPHDVEELLGKEYQKMLELFKDSPAYVWMTENAREEEREAACEGFRQVIVELVERRFPRLLPLAQKQVALVRDRERLQQVILHVSLDQDDSEIENLLLSLSKQTEDA
jgi:hypothetical protein